MANVVLPCLTCFAAGWLCPDVVRLILEWGDFFKHKKQTAEKKDSPSKAGQTSSAAPECDTFQEGDCPICFNSQMDCPRRVTTPCGHIFCKKCIKEAVRTYKECPICRRPCSVSSLRRVHTTTRV